MNYGYGPDCDGWKPRRAAKLADRLRELCSDYTPDTPNDGWTPGSRPYVEHNGLYKGVRIRRITNLGDEDLDKLVARMDRIYREVMLDVPVVG